ncbi:MAG: hypothetical protein Fur0032_12070 [Terrimicrobiaceae bacterium]
MGGTVAQPDDIENFPDLFQSLTLRFPSQQKGEPDIFPDGHRWEQIEKLKHNADMVSAVFGQHTVIGCVQGGAANHDFSGIWSVESAENVQQRTLPAAAGAGDRHAIAIANF